MEVKIHKVTVADMVILTTLAGSDKPECHEVEELNECFIYCNTIIGDEPICLYTVRLSKTQAEMSYEKILKRWQQYHEEIRQ